jgi:hypothetical protein
MTQSQHIINNSFLIIPRWQIRDIFFLNYECKPQIASAANHLLHLQIHSTVNAKCDVTLFMQQCIRGQICGFIKQF